MVTWVPVLSTLPQAANWPADKVCPSLRARSLTRAVKIPSGHSFPFVMASGTDSRLWTLPARLMKRFRAAEPDALLTFIGCAVVEVDDRAALAQLRPVATAFSGDGATGDAGSHAHTTPPMTISAKMIREEAISARFLVPALIFCHQSLTFFLVPSPPGVRSDGDGWVELVVTCGAGM